MILNLGIRSERWIRNTYQKSMITSESMSKQKKASTCSISWMWRGRSNGSKRSSNWQLNKKQKKLKLLLIGDYFVERKRNGGKE